MSLSIGSLLRRAWQRMSAASGRSEASTRRRRRGAGLAVEALENRLAPVIGAFDNPGPILAGKGFDGVAALANGTRALLGTGRHNLTAAHVGTQSQLILFWSEST